MDIITINTIVTTIIMFFIFKYYIRIKRRKLSLLLVKKYGGVPLSEKDRAFITKNRNFKFKHVYAKRNPITRKNIKKGWEKIINNLNPLRSYDKQLNTLKYDLSSNRSNILILQRDIISLKNIINELQTKKESTSTIVKKVQKKIKTKELSALINVNPGNNSSFV